MRKIIKQNATARDFADPTEDYLGFSDFALHGIKEKTYTIKSLDVDAIPIPMSGKTQEMVVATLEGAKKALIISKGKRKALIALFGAVPNWVGQSIKITADPTVKFKGEVCGGLKVTKP